jgi:uncharacterized protein YjbJ (UPF0337 family)
MRSGMGMEDKLKGKTEEIKGKVTKDKAEELKGKARQKTAKAKETLDQESGRDPARRGQALGACHPEGHRLESGPQARRARSTLHVRPRSRS